MVRFIDIGQGDATLIEAGEDDILVDGGPPGANLLDYLAKQHLPDIDLLVLTHPHSDHYGGLENVLAGYDVHQVWTNGEPGPPAWETAAAGEGAPVLAVRRGQSVTFGNVTLTVLHPAEPLVGDDNTDSVVLRLSCGSVSVLLTGDANRDSEESMLGDPSVMLDSDVLKVGHHGSATSTTNAFLDAVTAADAVISVGAGNSYHHPTPSLLGRLAAHGIPVYRTDLAGTVVLTSDCTTFTIGPESGQ